MEATELPQARTLAEEWEELIEVVFKGSTYEKQPVVMAALKKTFHAGALATLTNLKVVGASTWTVEEKNDYVDNLFNEAVSIVNAPYEE